MLELHLYLLSQTVLFKITQLQHDGSLTTVTTNVCKITTQIRVSLITYTSDCWSFFYCPSCHWKCLEISYEIVVNYEITYEICSNVVVLVSKQIYLHISVQHIQPSVLWKSWQSNILVDTGSCPTPHLPERSLICSFTLCILHSYCILTPYVLVRLTHETNTKTCFMLLQMKY